MIIWAYDNVFACVVALGAICSQMRGRVMLVWAQVYSGAAPSATDRQIARYVDVSVKLGLCLREADPGSVGDLYM